MSFLKIQNLSVDYKMRRETVYAAKNVNIDVNKGEILGLVGESGSGKSTIGNAIINLIDEPGRVSNGSIILGDINIHQDNQNFTNFRGKKIGLIFQDPQTSLNPIITIGEQLIETIQTHIKLSNEDAKNKAIKLLKSELIKKVSLVTPNIPEAEILTETKIISVEDMIYAANKLMEFGAKNVLIKGGHSKNKIVKDVFVNKKDIKIFNSARYNTNNTHGTGCTLSSAVTTFVSCGKPAKKSCELGIKYVNSAIKTNPNYGKGHGPINHLTSIKVNKKFN